MDLHLQTDWQPLIGQCVEVRHDGRITRTGTVDAVMPDDSILWISAEGAYQRKMIERTDGIQVYACAAGAFPQRTREGTKD